MKLFVAFRFSGFQPEMSLPENDLEAGLAWLEEHAAPLHLAAESNWLRQWEREPATVARVRHLVDAGRLVPLLTHSEGTHVAFLSPLELADELRLNRIELNRFFQTPDGGALGFWASAWGVDLDKLRAARLRDAVAWAVVPVPPAVVAAGFAGDEALLPQILAARTGYSDRMAELVAGVRAKRLGVDDAARNFAELISSDAPADPSDRPKLICLVIGAGAASWTGLIFSRALSILKGQGGVDFVRAAELGPDKTASIAVNPPAFGYYPDKHALVRTDGLYPAYAESAQTAEAYQPRNLVARHPFILWEEGRFLLALLDYFYAGFEFSTVSAGDAPDFQSSPAFLLRQAKSAAYWGPRPTSRERKAALVPLGAMVALFRQALNRRRISKPSVRLPESVTRGLRAVLRFQIDNPVAALDHYWKSTESRKKYLARSASLHEVREHRQRAWEAISRLESATAALAISPGAWFRAVDMLDVYVRELGLALELLEGGGVPEAALDELYRSFSPPQLPLFLDRMDLTGPTFQAEHPEIGRHSPREVPGEMHSW